MTPSQNAALHALEQGPALASRDGTRWYVERPAGWLGITDAILQSLKCAGLVAIATRDDGRRVATLAAVPQRNVPHGNLTGPAKPAA